MLFDSLIQIIPLMGFFYFFSIIILLIVLLFRTMNYGISMRQKLIVFPILYLFFVNKRI